MVYSYAVYLLFMNILAFFLMLADKRYAKKHKWRIPERVLLLTAVFGGCLGEWLGMYTFRHKTRHAVFVILMPLLTLAYAALTWVLFRS